MIVVDASVAVKWFYPEEREASAQRLIEGGERLLAPALIRVEVAAVESVEGLVKERYG